MINIDFSVDMRRIDLWAHRMGINLHDSMQLLEPYMLAQQYLLHMAELLVKFHGFRRIEPTHRRILFAIVQDADIRSSPVLTPASHTIELPILASSFFSPDRRQHWEHIFHNNNLWFNCGQCIPRANIAMDLIQLLQCLLPGMFLVVEVLDGWSTQRGIPPLTWLLEHKDVLVASVGHARFAALCHAAADVKRAVIDSRDILT